MGGLHRLSGLVSVTVCLAASGFRSRVTVYRGTPSADSFPRRVCRLTPAVPGAVPNRLPCGRTEVVPSGFGPRPPLRVKLGPRLRFSGRACAVAVIPQPLRRFSPKQRPVQPKLRRAWNDLRRSVSSDRGRSWSPFPEGRERPSPSGRAAKPFLPGRGPSGDRVSQRLPVRPLGRPEGVHRDRLVEAEAPLRGAEVTAHGRHRQTRWLSSFRDRQIRFRDAPETAIWRETPLA